MVLTTKDNDFSLMNWAKMLLLILRNKDLSKFSCIWVKFVLHLKANVSLHVPTASGFVFGKINKK